MSALEHFAFASPWYDLALFAFAAILMPAMSVIAGRQMEHNADGSLVPRYLFTAARGWLAAAAVLAVWHFAGRPLSALGLDIPIGTPGLLGFALIAVLVIGGCFQLAAVGKISPERLKNTVVSLKRMKITPRTPGELRLFLLVAITAGVWEELVYRGFLIWYLAPLAGVWAAVAISSVIFGLGHAYQGWRGVLTTGLIGLILAVAYALSGSLWWLMAGHAVIDIFGGLASYRLNRMARNSPNVQPVG